MGAHKPSRQDVPSALFGKTRRAVLALLLARPEEALYLRQIVRAVRCGQGGVQREVRHLTDAGVLVRIARGRTAFYQANRACPVFSELRGLFVQTVGAAEALPPAGWQRRPRRVAQPNPAAPSQPSPRETAQSSRGDSRGWSERMPTELL
jgi:hypothetical protein